MLWHNGRLPSQAVPHWAAGDVVPMLTLTLILSLTLTLALALTLTLTLTHYPLPLQDAWRAACDAGHSEREQLASAELRAQVTRHMTQLLILTLTITLITLTLTLSYPHPYP